MGVAFVPRRLAIQQKIHFLRIADTPVFRTVGLVSLRSRQTSEHIRCFSDLCIVHAKSICPSDLPALGASQKALSPGPKPMAVTEVQPQNA